MIIKNKSALEGSESQEETVYWVCQDPVNTRASPCDVVGSEVERIHSIRCISLDVQYALFNIWREAGTEAMWECGDSKARVVYQ